MLRPAAETGASWAEPCVVIARQKSWAKPSDQGLHLRHLQSISNRTALTSAAAWIASAHAGADRRSPIPDITSSASARIVRRTAPRTVIPGCNVAASNGLTVEHRPLAGAGSIVFNTETNPYREGAHMFTQAPIAPGKDLRLFRVFSWANAHR
jgi:hypothetical protein